MKQPHVRQLAIMLTLIALSGCTKKDDQAPTTSTVHSQPEPTAAPQASISFRSLYVIKANRDIGYLVAEFENTANVGVSAFKGTWTITDDLDDKLDEKEVRFTGDTQFATAHALVTHHIISPGETFVIINQVITGEDNKVYATTKTNIGNVITVVPNLLQTLDDYRINKKCSFDLEKVVIP